MKQCSFCSSEFTVSQSQKDMLIKLSPIVKGVIQEIPDPTHCPDCRQQRRFACRNDRNFYRGSCHVCKTKLITSYSPDKNIPVLCDDCFWSDKWDPLEYGQEFDFSKPFFEQFKELRFRVPRLAIYHTQSENSQYTVHSSRNKNCYIGSSLVDNEDVHFSDFTFKSKNSLDLYSCSNAELCYECVFCNHSFSCQNCESSSNISDCILCFDCKSSHHLFGCAGIRTGSYMVFNTQVSQEEFQETCVKFRSESAFKQYCFTEFEKVKMAHPRRSTWMISTENCTGNYLWDSKNVEYGFNARHLEDVMFAYEVDTHKDTCDVTRIGNGEMLYECASIVDLAFSSFCNLTYQCDNMLYSDNCNGTSNSFGCMSLKKHEYCILNRQYSKDEYENTLLKIIDHMRKTGEWGEFFPASISVFGYNESKAEEWFPLSKEEVQKNNWNWSEYESPDSGCTKVIKASQLPIDVTSVPDDILNWAIICEKSKKPFRIVKQELDFYRTMNIAIPKRSPKQRHYNRSRPHNVRVLYNRTCDSCSKDLQSIYKENAKETVYCESCYLKEVY